MTDMKTVSNVSFHGYTSHVHTTNALTFSWVYNDEVHYIPGRFTGSYSIKLETSPNAAMLAADKAGAARQLGKKLLTTVAQFFDEFAVDELDPHTKPNILVHW